MKPKKIDLAQKLSLFDEHWSPKIIGEVNDCAVGPTTEGRPTAVGSAGERPALTSSSSRGNSSGTSTRRSTSSFLFGRARCEFSSARM